MDKECVGGSLGQINVFWTFDDHHHHHNCIHQNHQQHHHQHQRQHHDHLGQWDENIHVVHREHPFLTAKLREEESVLFSN